VTAWWGAFALPSFTTLLWIADAISRHRILAPRERVWLVRGMAIVTIVFYPMAIGLVPVDAYRFGFTAWAPIALALIGIALAPRFFRLACALLVIVLLFDLHALPSLNLFDYVIDPIGGICAIGSTAITLAWRRRSPRS